MMTHSSRWKEGLGWRPCLWGRFNGRLNDGPIMSWILQPEF